MSPSTSSGQPQTPKIRIGWFSFSCCEDNTVIMTEVLNDHWQEWKKLFDIRHARVLQSHNVLDALDIAFIEGAIATDEHAEKVKEIRAKSKIVVAIGACAVVGMPSGQRNTFTEGQKKEIEFLIARFGALPKVLKLADVIKVDAEVGGCPIDPDKFLTAVNALVKQLQEA